VLPAKRGHAALHQGAILAFRRVDGARGDAGDVEFAHSRGQCFGTCSELGVERDGGAAAVLAVEECAGVDDDREFFFEAEGLGAELNFVPLVRFRAAAFVFDREGLPPAGAAVELDSVWVAGRGLVEFDDVGFAREAKAHRLDAEAARDDDSGAGFGAGFVDSLVQDAAFLGEAILLPLLFDVDESPLALAEEEVLEAGEREKVVFGEHSGPAASSVRTRL
jgi:hypothetical protein